MPAKKRLPIRELRSLPPTAFLDFVDGARFTNFGLTKFRRHVDAGDIKPVRIGKRPYVTVATLEAFMAKLTAEVAA
jgi:hypothetical protein